MKIRIVHRASVLACVIVLLLAVGLLASPASPSGGGNALHLQAPPFLGAAQAQEASIASLIGDEAGICAYFNAGAPVDLALVEGAYRTIEARTTDYLIGSVAVVNYSESYDVHAYVHKDGWFMTYYLQGDPVAKIFDLWSYNGTQPSFQTKFEKTLAMLANQARVLYKDPTYYDFRYPNANRLMLIGETNAGGDDFTITLPSTFEYYNRSWGMVGCGSSVDLHGCQGYFILDGNVLARGCYYELWEGVLTADQLKTDRSHTIRVCDRGGLALVYREP